MVSDAQPGFGPTHVVAALYLFVVVLGAINVPAIWAMGDALLCGRRSRAPRIAQYGLAAFLGLVGSLSLYFELRFEYPTAVRFVWLATPVVQLYEADSASLSDAQRLTQGEGLGYVMITIGYLVSVVSAAAPLATVYVRHRRVTEQWT